MQNWIAVLTMISMLLVVYHHAGYPLLLRFLRGNAKQSPAIDSVRREHAELPFITLVMPAYNERRYIAEKLRNLAVLDYPRHLLKVILACDGCRDGTAEMAEVTVREPECRRLDLEIRRYERNRGKVAVLNEVLASIDSELVVLSDVSALLPVDALRVCVAHFDQPDVGVVCGGYHVLNPGSEGEAAYWRYQSGIKRSESMLGSVLGAHGAFYAIRRELFRPLPPDTINDDFILPMRIVAAGYRAVYEPRIRAIEMEQADDAMDHARRRRIAAGNMQQLIRLRGLLSHRHGGVAFTFFSGKGLRVLMPYLMLIALAGSWVLAGESLPFLAAALAQSGLYVMALAFHLLRPSSPHRLLQTLYYLVSGHVAGLIGGLRYLLGWDRGRWDRVG